MRQKMESRTMPELVDAISATEILANCASGTLSVFEVTHGFCHGNRKRSVAQARQRAAFGKAFELMTGRRPRERDFHAMGLEA